jgi:hypothetical protein
LRKNSCQIERGEAGPMEVNEVGAAMAPLHKSMNELSEVGEGRGEAAEEFEDGPARACAPGHVTRGLGEEDVDGEGDSLSLPQFVGVSMGRAG